MYIIISFSVLYLIFLKSVTIGSEFNFWYWIKYGKKYMEWYSNKETFREYLIKENLK